MATFNRFDICRAYYCFAQEWASPKLSESIMTRLNRMSFNAGMALNTHGSNILEDNEREIFDVLVEGQQAVNAMTGRDVWYLTGK